MMPYTPIFMPKPVQSFRENFDAAVEMPGDKRDGDVYVYREAVQTDPTVLAVNVAIATHRPLLVRGEAGSGKSSLASNIARSLGWRYYEQVMTSRTQAQDLLWQFDAVRRLGDAQVRSLGSRQASEGSGRYLLDLYRYVEPGVLWWALDRATAERRGCPPGRGEMPLALDPGHGPLGAAAVVLIDEIDKADPDVPNNLLVVLGSLQFTVQEVQTRINADPSNFPLIVITTNEERELPSAFLRRCVQVTLPEHGEEDLVRIAGAHFGSDHNGAQRIADIYRPIAKRTIALKEEHRKMGIRPPSTAEYLDSVRACLKLNIRVDDAYWTDLISVTLEKSNFRVAGGPSLR